MEQFKHIGEAIGGLKALMVFQDEIQINKRQCSLLVDMIDCAYKTIAEEMKQNLRFEEKNTKWKGLEGPLRELLRIIREGEGYIRQCLETKSWWAKAISLYQSTDCVEFHIHNLMCCIPIVIEAIETAGEISGCDQDDIQRKRLLYSWKYHKDCKDPRIFEWRFGRQYLVDDGLRNRIDSVWEEDRWMLHKKLQDRKDSGSANLTKQEQRLTDLLLKNLNESAAVDEKLLPSSTLVSSKDYQVRRRLGNGSQSKEIQWLGESFALRHFFGDIEQQFPVISRELTLSHPNIMHIFCAFTDEEKKECYFVMELMNRDLSSYIKEVSGPKKRVPFSVSVAVDLMLQIARAMEYLHSKNIYHGDLNPSNILVKSRNSNADGYLHAKVCAFGPSFANVTKKSLSDKNGQLTIWYAPEVLAEQDVSGNGENSKYTEKADVYSFGMICFELLTGKVPFEDGHLQGDKMSRNIRAGERPLFPFYSPKYLTSLTKKCWHTDPDQRPSFTSICRILRCIKKLILMNLENGQPETTMPVIDYTDIEAGMLRSFPSWANADNLLPITQIPFQMFLYRIAEKEKPNASQRENYESGSDASACGDESAIVDEPLPSSSPSERRTSPSSEIGTRRSLSAKKLDVKATKQPGTPKGRVRPPQMSACGRTMRMNSESQLMIMSPRRRLSGHVSDSELS